MTSDYLISCFYCIIRFGSKKNIRKERKRFRENVRKRRQNTEANKTKTQTNKQQKAN